MPNPILFLCFMKTKYNGAITVVLRASERASKQAGRQACMHAQPWGTTTCGWRRGGSSPHHATRRPPPSAITFMCFGAPFMISLIWSVTTSSPAKACFDMFSISSKPSDCHSHLSIHMAVSVGCITPDVQCMISSPPKSKAKQYLGKWRVITNCICLHVSESIDDFMLPHQKVQSL